MPVNASRLYDYAVNQADGAAVSLADYRGQVLLIVNTATQCGFTPQYQGLEALYQKYRAQGFAVLAFPCNQFGKQEPGSNEEIAAFCEKNFGVSFPLFAKLDVNGADASPLFTWLKNEAPGVLGSKDIKWNFTKFLIARDGRVVDRFASITRPEKMVTAIENLLAEPA